MSYVVMSYYCPADFLPQPLLTGEPFLHLSLPFPSPRPESQLFPPFPGTECYSGLGRGYQGTLNVTSSGKPCQSWTVSSPHQHLLAEEGYVELAGGHNYCRNPGERGRKPWCFTTDNNTRWEYCDVVECGKFNGRELQLLPSPLMVYVWLLIPLPIMCICMYLLFSYH